MQQPPPLTAEKATLGIVAMIFGICGFIPLLGALLGLVGVIVGIIALATRKVGRGFAVAGLVLGLMAMLLHVVLVVPVLLYTQKRPAEIRPIVLERRALPPAMPRPSPRPAPPATNAVAAPAANEIAPELADHKTEGNGGPQQSPLRTATASSRSVMVLPAQEAAALLADVQSGEQRRLIPATMKLMHTRPEQPDPAMARALTVVLLENSSLPLRVNAARALENWGTAESLPALEKAAADPNPLLQTHAKKAGAKISGTAP